MAPTRCSCPSIFVAITKKSYKKGDRCKKHHAFCSQWAMNFNPEYAVAMKWFLEENGKVYFVVHYDQRQYLVDFERLRNVSPKLDRYFCWIPNVDELNNNKLIQFPDISAAPFDYRGGLSISIRPSVIEEFVNWLQGADTDHRKDDGRQAIVLRTINEYIELSALAQWYNMPALWNWCVAEVKCLPTKESKSHIAMRKWMNMMMLTQNGEGYKPYTVPDEGYVRLPRRWEEKSSAPSAEPATSKPATKASSSRVAKAQPRSKRSATTLPPHNTMAALEHVTTPQTQPFMAMNPQHRLHEMGSAQETASPAENTRSKQLTKADEEKLAIQPHNTMAVLESSATPQIPSFTAMDPRQRSYELDSTYGTASPAENTRPQQLMKADEERLNILAEQAEKAPRISVGSLLN